MKQSFQPHPVTNVRAEPIRSHVAAQSKPRMNTPGVTAETIGQHIAECRKSLGMSRSELAGRSGVDDGSLSCIERGLKSPGVRTLLPILAALYGRRAIVSNMKEPGRRIRVLRDVYLLTQRDLASLIGMNGKNVQVSRWEHGTALPSLAAEAHMPCIRAGDGFFFFSDGAGELMAKQRQRAAAINNLGERIGQLCASRGLSKREVERRAGLSRQHLHRIIVGRVRKPHSRTLMRIAKVLGVGALTRDRARIAPEIERIDPFE